MIRFWEEAGYLDLNPPYQRGEVWGETRRKNLIRSILQGIPIASIIVNDRTRSQSWGDMPEKFVVVIDGKQRISAVLGFLNNGFRVPAEWFDMEGEEVCFADLPISSQRRFRHIPMAFSEGSLPTIEAEAEVFELVNYGGVPQGQSDNL